jgi:hypothetical protein
MSSKVATPVAFPPGMSDIPSAPHPCEHLEMAGFWILAIPAGLSWYLVLICISLVTYDIEHLLFSFVTCIYSLVRCLFRSFHHFEVALFVFLLSFKSSLLVLDNSPLSNMSLKIFSPDL